MFPSILQVPLNALTLLILFLLLSSLLSRHSSQTPPCDPVSTYQSMARVQTQTRLPFPPINTKFTEAAFLPLTELSSQGWRVPPSCWREQHTSHMAAYTDSLNWEHTLRHWHTLLISFFPRTYTYTQLHKYRGNKLDD